MAAAAVAGAQLDAPASAAEFRGQATNLLRGNAEGQPACPPETNRGQVADLSGGKLRGQLPCPPESGDVALLRARPNSEAIAPQKKTGGNVVAPQKTAAKRTDQGAKKRSAPKSQKNAELSKNNIVDFNAAKRAKRSNSTTSGSKPARGQANENWLKSILPPLQNGAWWEVPADDRGFKIKLRWRTGDKKAAYTFSRIGKNELQTLMEKSYAEQRRNLNDRIIGELLSKGDGYVTNRLAPVAGNDNFARAEGF